MRGLVTFCAALLLAALPARADEVQVLAAGAAKSALERIAPAFTAATGHSLRASYDTVGAQRDRVLAAAAGEAADIVILSDNAIAQLEAAQRLRGDARPLAIGAVAVSLAVPHGTAVPSLASAEDLRRLLLAAPSIAYADPARGATAGTHFAQVLDKLELHESLKARLHVLPFGVDVIRDVSQGRYAIGVSQSSEILQHEGVTMVGPLPPPLALSTTYSAALASSRPGAEQLLQFLQTPDAVAMFRAAGFLAN